MRKVRLRHRPPKACRTNAICLASLAGRPGVRELAAAIDARAAAASPRSSSRCALAAWAMIHHRPAPPPAQSLTSTGQPSACRNPDRGFATGATLAVSGSWFTRPRRGGRGRGAAESDTARRSVANDLAGPAMLIGADLVMVAVSSSAAECPKRARLRFGDGFAETAKCLGDRLRSCRGMVGVDGS